MSKCPKICAGELNTLINVELPSTNPDGQGGSLPTEWIDYFQFMAKCIGKGGGERTVNGGVEAYEKYQLTSYYDSRLNTNQRVLFNGKIGNIRHIDNVNEMFRVMIVDIEVGVGT